VGGGLGAAALAFVNGIYHPIGRKSIYICLPSLCAMRRGDSQIVSFVLLVAIGAIIAGAFYYLYAGAGAASGGALEDQRLASLSRMKASVTFFAPQSMKNSSNYFGAVYNSGTAVLHGLELNFSSSGGLSLTDSSGNNLTYLSPGDVGFFSTSTRPVAGDVLMFHSTETNAFHSFSTGVSRVVLLQGQASLNSVDSSYENITSTSCSAGNRYSWYVGVNKSAISGLFLDVYARSTLGVTFVNVTDESGTGVIDSFDEDWERASYDISNANYAGDTLTLCVNLQKGDGINLDYMRAVVIY
jgi:hypothetical protein